MKKPQAPVIFEPPKSRPISDWHRFYLQDLFAWRVMFDAITSSESMVPGTWENTVCVVALEAFDAGELVALRPWALRGWPPGRDNFAGAIRR